MREDRSRQRNWEEWAQRGIDLNERVKHEQLHWDEWALRENVEIPRFPLPVKLDEKAKHNFPYPTEKWGYLSHVGRILGGWDWREKTVLQLGGFWRLVGKATLGNILKRMLQSTDYLIMNRVRVLRRLCLRVGRKISKKS